MKAVCGEFVDWKKIITLSGNYTVTGCTMAAKEKLKGLKEGITKAGINYRQVPYKRFFSV